ncbi:MAG: 16S rRNA (cytosine(1402)-N(4))-methyltransferase RsmH [Methylacidiphilales bacterium]|nr:16S rRNA (cytosine(1402)-N(4))-methyltransferase RsmH [Candidatus Methylacidiphilales bacterium]
MNPESIPSLDTENTSFSHIPVLAKEVIEGLNIQAGGHYLDATVGGGGHTKLILESRLDVKVTALDRDEDALVAARKELAEYGERVEFIHSNFATYNYPNNKFDGILADLGVSSHHLDTAERGFSFRNEGSLDMRMNRQETLTAADVINDWQEADLVEIFFKYGEERLSRRIVRRIIQRRPFQTTTELANAIASAVPPKYRYARIHPATRVFQALRIAVNDELGALETFLKTAPPALVPGGRLVVISFHSLEDRLVKHSLRDSELLQVITKKPITAQEEEIIENMRSRSAKLRVAQRRE